MSNNEQELVRRRGNSKEPVCDQEVLDSEEQQAIIDDFRQKIHQMHNQWIMVLVFTSISFAVLIFVSTIMELPTLDIVEASSIRVPFLAIRTDLTWRASLLTSICFLFSAVHAWSWKKPWHNQIVYWGFAVSWVCVIILALIGVYESFGRTITGGYLPLFPLLHCFYQGIVYYCLDYSATGILNRLGELEKTKYELKKV